MPPEHDLDWVVARIQHGLQARADERRREWWTSYLKGEAAFRGTAMADVRQVVTEVCREHVAGWPAGDGKRLALVLLRERLTEDKLAGVLLLAEHLDDTIGPADLPLLREPLADGSIADWSACDWYAVKVLGPQAGRHGAPFAEPLARWAAGDGPLWERRAPAAAFASLAAKPHPFDGFAALALEVCDALSGDDQRFAQTAVGWLLRELSAQQPASVAAFVETHGEKLSREARRMATARLEGRTGGRRRRDPPRAGA